MFAEIDKNTKITSLKFLFACYFLYTVSICIKMVYSAQMAEIISAVGSTKADVSLGLLFYYAAYFIAQLLFALLINKINLKCFITVTVSLSAISFGMIYFANDIWQLYLILFLNGFFQVGIWGGIMFFVGRYIPDQMSGFSSKFLTTGFGMGTAITYGASAFFISVFDWRYTFIFFSVLTVISIAVFLCSLRKITEKQSHVFSENLKLKNKRSPDLREIHAKNGSSFIIVLYFTLLVTVISAVYYAFIGWFPSLMIENFSMPTEYSVFLTLLLPLSMTPGSFVIIDLSEKSGDDYNVSLVTSLLITGLLTFLYFTYSISIFLTIVVSVVMLFCLRGLISMICAYVPLRYIDRIGVGVFSLILNAFGSLVAGIMPYLSSFVIENAGWDMFFILLTLLSFSAFLMTVFAKSSKK